MVTMAWSRRRVLELAALAAPLGASSAQTARAGSRRIGVLWLGGESTVFGPVSRQGFFRDGLRRYGWIEGQNLTIESRYVGTGLNLSTPVEQLLSAKVDVIVAMASPIALAAKDMTASVPIVFVVFGDPVEFGLIDSLAHPGGNLTGIYMPTAEHAGKRLGLLHEAVPGSTRIAVLKFPNSRARLETRITEAAAGKLGVELVDVKVDAISELEPALIACKKSGATAVTILAEPRASVNLGRIAEVSLAQGLPSIAGYAGFAWLGGFMAYGADGHEGFIRAAYFVARILQGERPADLPVEQSTKYVLALNKKTARTLRMRFPKSLIQYADFVIP
ncbi:ABC transporter substrate-binding protein [Variovorax sp. J2P1-59]|uniref:ABC transporter substrate-binding protein n=1 Tax=Variovorax flavidus TaxID=3053501 RepID=UPI0025756F8D|nr:ABC transporter substrate-binding protein [Variovorax sp. J2P1-59]MDM0075648.1 ABC transporter substrate-binding protein [Variovorax sp. J2P1-59]